MRNIVQRCGFALAVVCTATVILATVLLVGRSAIEDMLAERAFASAKAWHAGAFANGRDPSGLLAGRASRASVAESLRLAGFDALVVVRADSTLSVPPGGPEGAAADLLNATERARSPQRSGVFDLPAGAYARDRIGLPPQGRYVNWVLLELSPDASARLAVRVPQTALAGQLVMAFQQRLIYLAGVAAITFFSFMAGYTYREQQLAVGGRSLRYLALHDELTGLANRKQFLERLKAAMRAASVKGTRVGLFVLDLDGFKAVNDTFGHPVGDGLLKATSGRLAASLREGDLLARLSGDEFAILVPQVRDTSGLASLAGRIQQQFSTPFEVDGNEVSVGCSTGIAVSPDNGDTPDALVRNADFALYRAKNEGKRTWRFFDPDMAAQMKSRHMLEEGLRHALKNDLFTLLYQPQVSLESGEVTGYEALLRWRLPGKGLVPTAMFLSVAEESGFIVPIGEWVIRQAARDCRALPDNVRVAINLSAAQLKRDNIEDYIAETLRAHGVDPRRIAIEVNESFLGRNETNAFQRLEKIRALDVSVVMDNFGVGTSSLGLLCRYPFDKIKIDRTFMNGIEEEQKKRAVVAAICSLGRSLGMGVSGEGVETEKHARILRAAGCNEAQGYHFGHPRSLEQVLQDLGGAAGVRAEAAA